QRALERLDTRLAPGVHREWRLEALKGLGQANYDVSNLAEAETHFRAAVTLCRQMELSVPETVRLIWWLGQALFWQGRGDELISRAEGGLALLKEDMESVEAVLMTHLLGLGYQLKGESLAMHRAYYSLGSVIERLPF